MEREEKKIFSESHENSETSETDVDYILKSVPVEALYEQLAEECSELAQAALKASRNLRDENPTPKTWFEILTALEEEYSDVTNLIQLTSVHSGVCPNVRIIARKNKRWVKRIRKHTK